MNPDAAKCKKYAQFASHMVRWQFTIIYWFMFITNLLVLFLASWIYTKGQEALEKYADFPKQRSRYLRRYIGMCAACVLVSAVVVTMEAYALLALQFCDGEDLMSLYWSTWTMIQVGSLIAILGIILALFHTLQNRRHPPWALALGTPVLVIAGFLHLFHDCTRKKVKKMRRNSRHADGSRSMSNATTVANSSQEDINESAMGEFIGFTIDGGPIVRFSSSQPANFGANSEVLGFCETGRPIVAYRKDSIRFITDEEELQDKMEDSDETTAVGDRNPV